MTARLMIGDVRQRIKEIPDGSVDLVCTSPPFLALRRYGADNENEMGSEATPAAFIDALLSLTAEFRRVLAPHGSIAVELGDTFSGSGGAGGDYNEDGMRAGQARFDGSGSRHRIEAAKPGKLSRLASGTGWPQAKSLCLTPYLYPLALAYGRNLLTGQASPAGQWMVRNMIAWARPNPPVGDLADKVRPGTSYITVATTSPRRWFDLDAVRTPVQHPEQHATRNGKSATNIAEVSGRGLKDYDASMSAGAPPLDWWDDDYDPADPVDAYTLGHMTLVQATQPYRGSHFACWPAKLAQRLILMMCPPKVCTVCGAPSERITETEYVETPNRPLRSDDARRYGSIDGKRHNDHRATDHNTLGWTDCGHDSWRQGCVLDPFAGSGTTLAVATGCGRDAIGIELYARNADLIRERVGMFLEEVA
jgi:site-specific DNA-methyltransferase (adenine-specific)